MERHYCDRVGWEGEVSGTVTSTMLNWRATAAQRGTIQEAARACGSTMSNFMREAALEYAVRAMGTRQ